MNFRRQKCIFQNSLPYKKSHFPCFLQQRLTLTVTLLNKIDRIRSIVTAVTEKPESLLVSIVDNLLFLQEIQATPCVPHCENQNHYCHSDDQLHKSCDSQTWYTFVCSNSYRFYTYTPDIPICHGVYEVHGLWMSWQFPLSFFEFSDQPIMKTLSVILVWAYREECS